MGAVLDLSERFWRGEVRGPELVRASGAVEEIAPDVLFVHAFANVTALRTAAGLVLVDTGNYRARDKTFAAVRGWDARPLATAVYTHGHVDHACGLPPFLDEAQRHGWPRPRIVGHRDVARRFDRYRATAPWNGLINARQFSIPPSWPTEYDYPDTTYADCGRWRRAAPRCSCPATACPSSAPAACGRRWRTRRSGWRRSSARPSRG
jgi:hypothetical protein